MRRASTITLAFFVIGGVVLSATAGLSFPTGASRISGHGYNLYAQFPWSWEIAGGWGLSGMFTEFWFPGQPKSNAISEATFVVEREVGAQEGSRD